MKDFFKILLLQFNILLSSRIKVIISMLSCIAIPIFFPVENILKSGWNIDVYMTLPAMILFSEIYYLEYSNETIEILYCKQKRKSILIIQRFLIIFFSLMIMAAIVYFLYIIFNRNILWDDNFSFILILKLSYSVSCTIIFFGTFSMIITNILKSYFAGIGAALLLFYVFYFRAYLT